ncbi:FAD-dependent oxidoreductase [Pseudomonas aeruginosa]|uniref:FAD-dependent oxidoreductase n=1 Tax=Pseudomonas aeruginosa TaxID=287 RepID=UPI00287F5E74|nr:FAD-dependent oxidoreductase [Pseudomonas aeruginosa]
MSLTDLPVVVIGAGPVGLAAAAHLLARDLNPLVIEAGNQAGASISQWGHVSMFSPWEYNVDKEAAKLLPRLAGKLRVLTHIPPGASCWIAISFRSLLFR